MQSRWLHIVFYSLLGLMSLPLLWQLGLDQVLVLKPLKGYDTPKPPPPAALDAWWQSRDGSYQTEWEQATMRRHPLRPWLVRLNNQLKFDLFHIVNARYTVYGGEGYLFSRRDIDHYRAVNPVPDKAIGRLIRRLACVQDTLQKQGVQLLFMIAPSKVRAFPQYMPQRYTMFSERETTAARYLRWLDHYGINHLDFSALLDQMSDTVSYPLYARAGYHWTDYGVYVCADTLLRHTARLLEQPMPKLRLQALEKTLNPSSRDNDMGAAANLFFQRTYDTLAYPTVEPVYPADSSPPRVLTIGDSYYSGLRSLGLPEMAYAADHPFWYYNQEIRLDSGKASYKVKDIPRLQDSLQQYDLIQIMITELNLDGKSWGFIDRAFEEYYPKDSPCRLPK